MSKSCFSISPALSIALIIDYRRHKPPRRRRTSLRVACSPKVLLGMAKNPLAPLCALWFTIRGGSDRKGVTVRWLLIPLLLLMRWFGQQDMDAAIWYDEWFSVRQAGGGNFGPLTIGEVWQHVMEDVFETPAHYILLSEWGKLVGWTEYAARALSLLLGLLAASWMYRPAPELFSPLVGLSAATIFGMSALYLYHMHQMRTYTLLALLSIVVVWCYWRVIQSPAARWKQAALVLSTTALLYTHYMG